MGSNNHKNMNPENGTTGTDDRHGHKKSNDEIKIAAKFIAMIVRNGIEDFHCKYLTDEQMRELNPLVRNAIYTALYVMQHSKDDRRFDEFTKYIFQSIPSYWEDPELWLGAANPQEHSEEPTL